MGKGFEGLPEDGCRRIIETAGAEWPSLPDQGGYGGQQPSGEIRDGFGDGPHQSGEIHDGFGDGERTSGVISDGYGDNPGIHDDLTIPTAE